MSRTFLKPVAILTLSLGLFSSLVSAQAQQRLCAGSCDEYGDPVYNVDQPYDDGLRYSRDYERRHRIGTPGYIDIPEEEYHSERRYRRYKRRSSRRHYGEYRHKKRRYRKRSYQTEYYGGIDTSNRTEFCRERYERRGDGWFKRKVRIKRCVWVRNDLLGHGHHNYRYSDDW